jgi:hypothetical protein
VWVDGAAGTEGVELACTAVDVKPVDDDWQNAAWDQASVTRDGAEARLLIGPGGVLELPVGTYDVWARVTAPIERPVLYGGQLPIV